MNVREGNMSSPTAADLIPATTHFELQLEDPHHPTYTNDAQRLAARTRHMLERESGLLQQELHRLKQLPEPASDVVAASVDARAFVERTVAPVSHAGLYGTPPEYSPTGLGFSTALLGAVAIRPPLHAPGSYQAVSMQAALAHEYAHSTAQATRRITLIDHLTTDEDGDQLTTYYQLVSAGMQKPKYSIDRATNSIEFAEKNYFLEEAFAEETASRYRATMYGDTTQELAAECSDGVTRTLPQRYFSLNQHDHSTYRFIPSAFAAHAVQLLSEYIGSDLYDLLVLSRDPAYEVAAKRGIVSAIEGAQKGLYRQLRDAPYPTSPEFYQLYDTIVALTQPQSSATNSYISNKTGSMRK